MSASTTTTATSVERTKACLILGAGMVTPPAISYLATHGFAVTVASRTLANATKSIGSAHATAVELDVETPAGLVLLDEIIPRFDAVLSLLPYTYHPAAARIAIKHGKHFFTTSYVSDAMRELDSEARAAGIVLLNECGVDPGTDHMSAMRLITEFRRRHGVVRSFKSYCGGLPAPQDNNNPLGYKFSWAPRGVLLASKNSATFLQDGGDVTIPGAVLFDNYSHDTVPGLEGIQLESYPNRNSKQYIDVYGIHDVHTMVRGTYRYAGWCRSIKKLVDLGLLNETEQAVAGRPFRALVAELAGVDVAASAEELVAAVARRVGVERDDKVLSTMEWLGLFGDELVPTGAKCLLDALCLAMRQRMQYAPGEQDMIAMKHEFVVDFPDRTEHWTSSLVDFGIKGGDTSMARTVSLPVAIVMRLVLQGLLPQRGLLVPIVPELYVPILDELASLGIRFDERLVRTVPKDPVALASAPARPRVHLWLRAEVKRHERRTPLTPDNARRLLATGDFRITVERSDTRCFPDAAFVDAGCEMADSASWPQAPLTALILGLKDLPDDVDTLHHRHIFFAHCFKSQSGWQQLMQRFLHGQGEIFDLEFLVDEEGRRVAAFGHMAGLVGAGLGVAAWAYRQTHSADVPFPQAAGYESEAAMLDECRRALEGRKPRVLVFGALGRCGRAAVSVCRALDLEVLEWDMAETARGGPFAETLAVDIVINCIYLSGNIPPFITNELLQAPDRKLSMIIDVSCDPNNPNNPVPIYAECTDIDTPCVRVASTATSSLPVDVIAIDHLPTLLPAEASITFSDALMPSYLELNIDMNRGTWLRAINKFHAVAGLTRAALYGGKQL